MEEKFTFFYRSHSYFSQWYDCEFELEGTRFNCAEQYMMYQKAVLFKDLEIAEKIMQASHPREQKKLGRKVRNFNFKIWTKHCKKIVYDGNLAKFSQNEELKKALFDTQGTTLVEASPSDKIWGIGLAEDDARAYTRSTWQGKNWLGEVLTKVREDLLALEKEEKI